LRRERGPSRRGSCHLVRIERQLSDLLKRKVDVVEKRTFKKTIAERVESEAVLAL
jgi:predicted nucleotidyltransferase